MNFDFSALSHGTDLSAITDPVALFDALPNKEPGLGYLRQVQATVLKQWSSRRDEPDLVLKTNTGTGKTIVGLLVLQASLHDKTAPALYLAPDPHLAARVEREGHRLGLSIVTDPTDAKFHGGDAICVTTLQTLVNGRSRFGVAGIGAGDWIRVGTIVIDDAHSAVTRMEELSRVRVPPEHPAHDALLTLFTDELSAQAPSVLLDIQDGERGAVLRVPFWAWQDKISQVLAVLHPLRTTDPLGWFWPLAGDRLELCQAVLTCDGFEIAPPLPPIHKFPSFTEARRRVYMTATLANDSVLVTHFAAEPGSIAHPILPDTAGDLGDRLVLAPQALLPQVSDEQMREAIATLAVTYNVVVLVPSHRRAAEWADVANVTAATGEEISRAVDRLQRGPVGLVVIVNRYDGIDLPDDACRVLVVDGLPQAASGADRREAAALRDSDSIVTRQLQRFEQGMGRAVRSRDDRCVVLVLERKLVELVSRVDVPARLSPGTRAQLELSRQVSRQLERSKTLNLDQVLDLIRQVVDGAADFKELSRQALLDVHYEPSEPVPTAAHLRNAYDAAVRGDLEVAARTADCAVKEARNTMHDERLAAWLAETAASYWHAVDPATAQSILTAAAKNNPLVLRPIGGLSFTPQRPLRKQAEQAVEHLVGSYGSGADMRLGVEATLSDLAWDKDRTEDAEEALAELGRHLGFVAQRPEKESGVGSDALWALGDQKYIVIEAKTGAETAVISKRDINQLGGSVRWAHETLGPGAEVIPMIVHPSNTVERSGTPPPGARAIDRSHLQRLTAAVRTFATALAIDDRFREVDAVSAQLLNLHLNGLQVATTYATAVRTQGT